MLDSDYIIVLTQKYLNVNNMSPFGKLMLGYLGRFWHEKRWVRSTLANTEGLD